PPLLAIMGMSGTALHWGEPFLSRLRESFEVIVYDHRGVGSSSRLEGPITIARMAADAVGLVRALELDSVHLLGISMGGMVAQELVLANPELVRTLTLGCTYCGGPGSSYGSAARDRLYEAMSSGDRVRALRAAYEINLSPAAAADPELWERFQSIAAERAVAVPVIMAQVAACFQHDTHARLPDVSAPTLVIHGTADEMIPVQNGRLIASLVPGARLKLFEEVGHLFFWEQPAATAELVRSHAAVPA
ncbi:MAG TPA: alpha/beta fold hydrolase, partial [Solirubrobacteraceae bacterium]|nr:alpha/beta fold hydrolase [Solirubrobacteraceae bacterium]